MPQMTYRGNRTANYNHADGTGLLGKVLGPNVNGEYFVITAADYDADSDTTFATAMQLRRPEALLQDGPR